MKQQRFGFTHTHWKFKHSHGGSLRNFRKGRGVRPLSSRDPLHLVIKANKVHLRTGFRTYRRYFLILKIMDRYSRRFFIKIEQFSVQNDHIHLLIRSTRRSQCHHFFRVFSGQIAQQFEKQGLVNLPKLTSVTDTPAVRARTQHVTDTPRVTRKTHARLWKYRPFTRVVRGWRAYKIVRNYIELNEHEALGRIPYSKLRLKGLSSSEWELVWS